MSSGAWQLPLVPDWVPAVAAAGEGGLLPVPGDQALGSSAPKDLGEQRVWPLVPWWVTPGASTSPVGGHVCSRFSVGSDSSVSVGLPGAGLSNSSVHPGLRELKGATVRIPTWLRATSL